MRVRSISILAILLMANVSSFSGSAVEVTIDGAVRYRRIEGFGTCLIAWVGRFRDLYRTEEYVKLHDRQGVPFYAVSPGNEVQFSMTPQSIVTFSGKGGR